MPVPIYDKLVSAFSGPIIDGNLVDDYDLTNVVYVNTNGDNANDGRSLTTPVATFARALTLAGALTDTKTIICLDAHDYNENLSITFDGLLIYAPNATLGTINTTGRDTAIKVYAADALTVGINSVLDVHTVNGNITFEAGAHVRTEVIVDNLLSANTVSFTGATGTIFTQINRLDNDSPTIPATLILRGHLGDNIHGAGANISEITAQQVSVDATGFDGNLDTSTTNVQLLAQAVDDLNLSTSAQNFIRVRPSANQDIATTGDTVLSLATVEVNTNTTLYSIVSNQIQVATAGTYLLLLNHTIEVGTDERADPFVRFRINGTNDTHITRAHYARNFTANNSSAYHSSVTIALLLQLSANDLVTASVAPGDTTLTANQTTTVAAETYVQIVEMQGVVGPQGAQGIPGQSAAFAATARYDTLFSGVSDNATANDVNVTLTFPDDLTALSEFALVEIGTSRIADGGISYNILPAATVATATSTERRYFFPTGVDGAGYLGSTYSVYLSDATTLVYRSGANRAFLRSVRGISFGLSQNPLGWIIQDMVITPDPTATPVLTLPSAGVLENYAYRISGNGYIRGTEVTDGDWLLALQDTPSPTDLSNWDIIAGNRFPTSSTLFHFDDQISEADNRVLGTQVSTAVFYLLDNIPTTPPTGGQTGQYTATADRTNSVLVVALTSGASTADLVFRQRDGGHDAFTLIFADNFHDLNLTDPSFDYYLFGTSSTVSTVYRYLANTVLEVVQSSLERHFTINADTVNLTQNISDLQISQLEPEARALLQSDQSLSASEQVAVDGLTTTTAQVALPNDFTYYIRYGEPSGTFSDYDSYTNQTGFLPHFRDETVTILINKRANITSVSRGTNLRFVGIILDRKAYIFDLPASTDPNNNATTLVGTLDNITLTGAIFTAANGGRWQITVANDGTLTTTVVT